MEEIIAHTGPSKTFLHRLRNRIYAFKRGKASRSLSVEKPWRQKLPPTRQEGRRSASMEQKLLDDKNSRYPKYGWRCSQVLSAETPMPAIEDRRPEIAAGKKSNHGKKKLRADLKGRANDGDGEAAADREDLLEKGRKANRKRKTKIETEAATVTADAVARVERERLAQNAAAKKSRDKLKA